MTALDPKALEAAMEVFGRTRVLPDWSGPVSAAITAYLAALSPSSVVVPSGDNLPRIDGIDRQVLTAARDDGPGDNPAWLWHNFNSNGVTYGRWAKQEDASPYIRADIVLHALSASPSPPALDGAGRDGIDKAIALLRPAGNIAYNMAAGAQSQNKDGAAYEFGRIRDAIDAAIRALKETP